MRRGGDEGVKTIISVEVGSRTRSWDNDTLNSGALLVLLASVSAPVGHRLCPGAHFL